MIASRPRLFGALVSSAVVAIALLAQAAGSMTRFDATVDRAGQPQIHHRCSGMRHADAKPIQPQLEIIDRVVGAGVTPQAGQTIVVAYTGWLWVNGALGPKFDSAADHGGSIHIPFGKGVTIAGWEKGLEGMRVGGTRTLIIPPEMGYGPHGVGRGIPPNATLRFDVELLAID